MDKHADKANGIRNTDKIYSYSSRSNLVDLSANFANYMREVYPEVHKVSDIQAEHIQCFLNSKTEICSQLSLNQYGAMFRKLENCINANNYEFQRFLLRGKTRVKLEILLLCIGYNINKLHVKIQNECTGSHFFPVKETS